MHLIELPLIELGAVFFVGKKKKTSLFGIHYQALFKAFMH
jgi:hypothetical protein